MLLLSLCWLEDWPHLEVPKGTAQNYVNCGLEVEQAEGFQIPLVTFSGEGRVRRLNRGKDTLDVSKPRAINPSPAPENRDRLSTVTTTTLLLSRSSKRLQEGSRKRWPHLLQKCRKLGLGQLPIALFYIAKNLD
jgi:hypothetical protein